MHAQPIYTYELLRSSEGAIDYLEQPRIVHVSMAQSPLPLPLAYNTHGLIVEVNFFILKVSTFSFFKLHVCMLINL